MKDFAAALASGRVLFDGGMGALLAAMNIKTECPEELGHEQPDLIRGIHAAYRQAGSQVVITNSLGIHPVKLGKTGRASHCEEWTRSAVNNAVNSGEALLLWTSAPPANFSNP